MNPGSDQTVGPSVEIVTMTPEWAKELLARNPRNRRLVPCRMHGYAEDMRQGRWLLTPEPIALDINGSILNGQHRLWAIIETGVTIQTCLATGFDPLCFSVIDTGATRSMSDIITIRHKDGNCSDDNFGPNTCAAILRAVVQAERFPDKAWNSVNGQKLVTKSALLKEFEPNEAEYRSAAKISITAANRFKYISRPALGALIVLAKRQGYVDVDKYVEILGTGAGLQSGNAVLALRTYLLNTSEIAYVRKRAQPHLAVYIKNFRQWREGSQVTLFKAPPVLPLPRLKG